MIEDHVIDENVLVVANGEGNHLSVECQLVCVEFLLAIRNTTSCVVDSGGLILKNYAGLCSWAGQPGVGDEFFRWAWDNQGYLRSVAIVESGQSFLNFPADERLESFDRDDRVYVAVAVAASCPIANASDSDYSHHGVALHESGIVVKELCMAELKSP